MNELVEFLLARIAGDEERARTRMKRAQETQRMLKDPWFLGRSVPGWHDWPDIEADAARVLRRCEADRRIVEELSDGRFPALRVDPVVGQHLLRILALPYADHPDFRAEWKP